jgi:flagellar basal-body rod modification protein FlgD
MDSTPITTHPSSLLPASQAVASALAPKGAPASKANSATSNASGTSGTSGTASTADTSDPSTITSSDFLTLLVSELQNQDPTQPTDPNAYISQLVGVNSLQQLIFIDQGITSLSSAAATASSPTNSGSSPGVVGAAAASGTPTTPASSSALAL